MRGCRRISIIEPECGEDSVLRLRATPHNNPARLRPAGTSVDGSGALDVRNTPEADVYVTFEGSERLRAPVSWYCSEQTLKESHDSNS